MVDIFEGLGESLETENTNENEQALDNMESQNTETKNPTPRNSISVYVTDTKTPILLLFGATFMGKTMTLIRLAKYLRQKGYQLEVDTNFCHTAWEYEENANNFNDMLSTNTAVPGTDHNDFLFVKVADKTGTAVCQILEGAGEDYFKKMKIPGQDRSKLPFPAYMSQIFTQSTKKIWIFLTVPNWEEDNISKSEYVQRIQYCKNQHFSNHDKAVILYNKVDTTGLQYGQAKVNIKEAMRVCNNEYPGLFEIFRNTSALAFLQDKYNCKFVPFSTGRYGEKVGGEPQQYTPSNDKYPEMLWEVIKKCIKG